MAHEYTPETLEYIKRRIQAKGFASFAQFIGIHAFAKVDLLPAQLVQGLKTGSIDAMYRAHVKRCAEMGRSAKSEEKFEHDLLVAVDMFR